MTAQKAEDLKAIATGLFTAESSVGGRWTVTANAGSPSGTSQVTVTLAPPVMGESSGDGGKSGGGGCGAGAINVMLLALPLAFVGRRRRARP